MNRAEALRILGLATSASDAEIDAKIATEYRTWSSRTNAPDFEARTEAQRRLNELGTIETVLLGKRQGRDAARPQSAPPPPPPVSTPSRSTPDWHQPSPRSSSPPPPAPTYAPTYAPSYEYVTRSKAAAVILAVFLGVIGVHRFYLGQNGAGWMMLLATVLSCGILAPAVVVWGLIDAVIILGGGYNSDSKGRPIMWT